MDTPVGKLVDEALAATYPQATTNRLRADVLEEDPATMSRIVNGKLPLTEARATKWAGRLFPGDAGAQQRFITRASMLPRASKTATVDDFCQSIVASGGAVPAERIGDLFEALQATDRALVCIEYRDLPRTSPEAKYEELGSGLVGAVAAGVGVAMFQPFGGDTNIPLPEPTKPTEATASLAAATYMRKVRGECRAAYRSYRDKLKELKPAGGWQDKLRLYERCGDEPYLGSGFQGKMFLVQYHTLDDTKTRHRRILQWLTTPRQDLIIYRGEQHIDVEALRDTFFPIVHAFETDHALPSDVNKALADVRSASKKKEDLPTGAKPFWKSFEDPS